MARSRLGLIVPSSNTTMEEEFRRVLPSEIALHVSRVRLRKVNVAELSRLRESVIDASLLLADADVDLILFGCTSGSLLGGVGYDLELSRLIMEATGIKAITTATAVVDALRAVGVRRLCVATPYVDEVNAREKEFLENNGFEVVRILGLGIESNLEIGRVPPQRTYELALRVFSRDADGLFISCTNLKTMEVIAPLEGKLGRPVVTSNQASLWAALRGLGWAGRMSGYGVLLEKAIS